MSGRPINIGGIRAMAHPSVRQRVHAMALAQVDAQRMVVRCRDCRWSFRGLVGDGKRAFTQHRELKHNERSTA